MPNYSVTAPEPRSRNVRGGDPPTLDPRLIINYVIGAQRLSFGVYRDHNRNLNTVGRDHSSLDWQENYNIGAQRLREGTQHLEAKM
jgi:hypothetical protein